VARIRDALHDPTSRPLVQETDSATATQSNAPAKSNIPEGQP